MFLYFLIVVFIGSSGYIKQGLNRSILFSDILDIFIRELYFPFRFLMFVPFSISPFIYSINWLNTTGFSDLLTSYSISVLPTIFLSTFISITSNIYLVFFMFPPLFLSHIPLSAVQLPYMILFPFSYICFSIKYYLNGQQFLLLFELGF